uniref:RING-type domain-containing protein n=2 Tax=Tetranychus urticae TaxID=32264 RepID=T1K3K0_TETUR
MSGATISEDERSAIERFRNVIREALAESPMNNFYNRVHILLYNRHSLLREWIEISTINQIQSNIENQQQSQSQGQQEQQVQQREEQEQQDDSAAEMSESLTGNMRSYIRERANTSSMRCRITRNGEWGLGLSLLDRDNYVQFFLPLERVRDTDHDATVEEEEEQVSDSESSVYDEAVNHSLNLRTSTPVENPRELLINEMESDIESNETDEGSEANQRLIHQTKLRERIANLYIVDTSFFRVIRTRDDYEKGLPSDVQHKIPLKASTTKYLILRSAYFKNITDLSRMAIAFPNMKQIEARIETFEKHDGHIVSQITPSKYAEAGFFSYGEHDAVTCYFCAGTIANWLPNDDPWQIHANLFPDCMYVYLKRGRNFIRLQLAKVRSISSYEPPKEVDDDKSRYECKICLSAEISVVFKPCEHMITCYDCATQFTTCPWCKSTIYSAVRCIIST